MHADPMTLAGSPAWGRRMDRWLLERLKRRRGPTRLPRTLEYRHIFVMPTRFGFWFGVLLALLALGGLNFNNNMALLLAFLLAAVAQMTTLLAYRNLVGLTVRDLQAEPVFAGQKARFTVVLHNSEARNRFTIQALGADSVSCADVEASAGARLTVTRATERRGWLQSPPFRLENRYPLGLFRAWSVFIPEARCLVYPAPAPHPPPLPRTGRGDHGIARKGDGEHLHGLREYQPGDPIRRVAWRTSARHGKLYSREMETPREEACEFNWYLMGGKDVEEKLSILTAWILRAERRQIPYSLEMPSDALPADLGESHCHACLRILAEFGDR
jgi:uncharacterized protein (DUF58 family)